MEQLVFVCFLVTISSALDHSLITVSVPPVSGVLLLTGPKGQYQFNFSVASEACLFKNLSMATRSQLQIALDHGLEACRFGWISERIAALPRLSSVSNCGSGKTGVVTWNAFLQQQFGVWCFNQSDSNEAEKTTAINPQITTTSTTTAFLPQRTITSTLSATATITEFSTTYSTAKPWTLVTAAPDEKINTTRKPSAHSEAASTQFTTTTTSKSQNPLNITSTSAVRYDSMEPAITSASAKPPRTRTLSTALIAFCVIVLVLTAGGAAFYYKLSERWVWPHTPQKDDIETETWKQTSSEVELQEETEGEGRRFSSETMLYVNHDAQTD